MDDILLPPLPSLASARRRELLERTLAADAALDAPAFASLFLPAGTFQIGALPQATGPAAIAGLLGEMFAAGVFASIRHQFHEVYDLPSVLLLRGTATFPLVRGGSVAVPYMTRLFFEEGLYRDYRVHIDLAPILKLLVAR